MILFCRLTYTFVFVWYCSAVPLGYAGDWLQADFPLGNYDPLRVSHPDWVHLSLQAGEYRAAVEHNGSSSVARTMTLMPSILVTPPRWQWQPYIGAGFGWSMAEMAPGHVRVPLQLEESLVMHISGGIAYRLGPDLALTSSARFAHFRTSGLVGRFASPDLPLSEEGLDFNTYSVQFGIRLNY